MDPNSGLAILGTAIGSAKLIEKVLGPTADYLGTGIRDFTQHRVENVKRIFQRADAFLGDSPQDGQVPPRVLRDILNDGSYRDDELTASYYGGILASSRSGIPRDDRGAAFTALVGRLTTYQLRAHYVLYRIINELYSDTNVNLREGTNRETCRTFLPVEDYMAAMDPQTGEGEDAFFPHVLFGLEREGLIGADFSAGSIDKVKQLFPNATGPGLIFTPSGLGIELFLWATGNSSLPINAMSHQRIALPELAISSCTHAVSTKSEAIT